MTKKYLNGRANDYFTNEITKHSNMLGRKDNYELNKLNIKNKDVDKKIWSIEDLKAKNELEAEIKRPISLNSESNDENIQFSEIIGFEDSNQKIDILMLKNALKKLNKNEFYIINKFYYEGFSDVDLSKEFNCSRQNIQRERKKILNKLKKEMS